MKKRLLASILIAVMVLSLAACGKNGAGGEGQDGSDGGYQTTYGSKTFDNVTIKVELFDRSNAPEGSTITENRWTKYCQDAMKEVGINLEFVSVPRADEVTKMQTMVSSGTAPTITLTYTYSYALDYFNDGGIWDVSEFIDGEDQAKNLKAYLGDDCLNIARTSDGNLYGVVARRATVASNNIFIRKDWLDDLGLEVPKTTEDLKNALHEMVYNNPDGNTGVVGATFNGLESNSTAKYRNIVAMAFMENVKDEKALAVNENFEFYGDPGYREYLRFVNEMYNEGLMDMEYFASTDDILSSNFVNGKLGFFERNVGFNVDVLRGSLLQGLKEKDPSAEFVAMDTLESNVYKGECFTPAYGEGGLVCFFPKTASAEEVEAAITYLDWLATEEGGFAIYHGIEGEHFEYNEDGVPIAKDAKYNAQDKDWIRTDLFLVGNQGYFTDTNAFNVNIAADNPGWEEYTIADYEASLYGTAIPNAQYMYAPDSELDVATDLDLLKAEYQVKVVTCSPDQFDTIYDEWLAAAKAAGIDDVLADREAIYEEVKGK